LNIAVGDDVLLAFEPKLAVIPAGGQRPARDEGIVCHHLGPDEAALDIRVNFTRCELGDQTAHVNLGAAFDKRHLGLADDHRANAHRLLERVRWRAGN
jgi:hypothetical protein